MRACATRRSPAASSLLPTSTASSSPAAWSAIPAKIWDLRSSQTRKKTKRVFAVDLFPRLRIQSHVGDAAGRRADPDVRVIAAEKQLGKRYQRADRTECGCVRRVRDVIVQASKR